MTYKNILMAVEPNFNNNHVGVRRVIQYHFESLVAAGHSVSLAIPTEAGWKTCSLLDATQAVLGEERAYGPNTPTWQTGDARIVSMPLTSVVHRSETHIKWTGKLVRPEDFDESILSNPWLCVQNGTTIEDALFSVGIVYDMVPNLISMGVLHMPQFLNVYSFAHEHHVGYDYFIRNTRRISCISQSTRQDFISMYGDDVESKLDVCIPFKDFGNGTMRLSDKSHDVLLINVLDHRKNFSTVLKTLKIASKKLPLGIVIVGKERLPLEDVMSFLSEMASVCTSVRWYRSPSDFQVEELMLTARVLFFPSIYEGLGLPILEAQAKGVPVISSNTSSCKEINLNPNLTAGPYEHEVFAAKLIDVFDNNITLLSDENLRKRQQVFLQEKNNLSFTQIHIV